VAAGDAFDGSELLVASVALVTLEAPSTCCSLMLALVASVGPLFLVDWKTEGSYVRCTDIDLAKRH
jgi:hypothetical protein